MASQDVRVIIIGDSRSVERAFNRSSKAAGQFNVSMLRTRDIVKGLFAAGGIATGITGFSRALVGSISTAAKFEQTMQRIVGLSGVAQTAIGGLTDEILRLAPSVGRAPQELAEGLQFITSSGVPAAKAMAVLEASARASAAGLGETKTVADAVTSVMNAYGAANVNAARATDVLVATVREGKGEASDFAGVIGNVVSIASQLGVSFEDVGASLAAMTRLGTDAETASTQLQQVFSNLVKVSPQAEEAFKRVGLSSAGLRAQIADKGLLAGLRTIQTAFAGDLPGLAKAFGDIRALRGVLALVGNQAETTRGIFGRLSQSSGDLADSFAAVSDTTAQKFNRLNAAIDTVQITIGAALAPAAEKAATAIADWLAVSGNQERVQRAVADVTKTVASVTRAFIDVLTALRAVLGPVVDGLGGLENAVRLVVGALIASKVYAFSTAITALGTSSAVASGKVTALGLALRRLALIGAIAIPIEVIINREAISRKFNEITDSLPFGRGLEVKVDASSSIADLQKLRENFVLLEGAESSQVKQLDKVIARMRDVKSKKVTLEIETQFTGDAARDGGRRTREGGTTVFAETITKAVDDVIGGAQKALDTATRKIKQGLSIKDTQEAMDKQRDAFGRLIDSLQLAVDRAGLDRGLKNDLAALQSLKAGLEKQISAGVDVASAQSRLVGVVADIADTQRQITQRAQEAVQARQFKALGLTGAGEEIIPTIENLKKQLASLSERLIDSDVTSKLTSRLAGVRKILSGQFGKATDETRAAINELFKTIRGEFEKGTKGPLTKTVQANVSALTKGLTLPFEDLKTLQSRLSSLNSAGVQLAAPRGTVGAFGVPVGTQTDNVFHIYIDGEPVEAVITRRQQKKSRRSTATTRGPFAGRRSGV